MAKFGRAGNGPVPKGEPGALERLKVLEGKVKELEGFRGEVLRAIRQTFAAVEQRLGNLEEVNEGVVNVVGRAAIEEEVKRLHIERVEAKAAAETAALDAAYAAGKIVDAEEVGDMSVIVGSEVDKDGNKLYPSTVQLLFATLTKEYQEKLRGAKAKDVITTPFESKFTVSKVYNIDPNASNAVQQAQAAVPPAGTPPIEAEPLSPEAEEMLLEGLASAAEQIESEKAAADEQLIDDLNKN
jgi:hypothetical protein